MMRPIHDIKIRAPYFADRQQGTVGAQLHRYLVPEFVPQFLQQLHQHTLGHDEFNQWQQSDRFSSHDKSLVLRLPIHKTFYLVSCEVNCNRLGLPAFDEAKITSAGYVIRRLRRGKEYSWMLKNGEAMGWEHSATGQRDPDVHRRMCPDGSLHPREDVPSYTGEQTHPLHPQSCRDENGKRHTVLYGFVALGGQYIPRASVGESAFDDQALASLKNANKQQLPWPYGERNGSNKFWQAHYTQAVNGGKVTVEFFELLRLLINRYHLGEAGIKENRGLKDLAKSIYFYSAGRSIDRHMRNNFSDTTRNIYHHYKKYSLWAYLKSHFESDQNPLIQWMALQEKEIDSKGGIELANFSRLPQRDGSGSIQYSLFVSPSDAREFRSLLQARVIDNANAIANEIPVSKFQQGEEDVYQIVPFVRVEDRAGKERIFWADSDTRSEVFRVASHFDPHASRPTSIAMPSLKDLRAGMAKGVSMITPADTFSLINALKLKKGASEDVLPEDEGPSLGIQWICSFSIPVITLVAMILLMIMVSLLNIIFFWLPWIKICLPFPKINK